MIELNSKLLNESSKPFHSYLLISGSSRYLIDQAKAFSSNLLFNSTDILEHPDIRVVTSENINTLGVDDIRKVITNESIYPIEAKYKIFIFPPTKSLTEEASNALLKTLEEPSSSNIFIITTYDFEFEDIINFLDMEESLLMKNHNDELSLITSILKDLKPPQQNANEKMFNLIKLENAIDEINVDSNSNLNILEKSIEYLVNNILSTTNFTKVEFRYSELLTNFIEDISLGLRPRIAINKLVLESEGI